MASITASSRDATAIPQPHQHLPTICSAQNHMAHRAPPLSNSCSFGPRICSSARPKAGEGQRTSRRGHGKLEAPLRDIESGARKSKYSHIAAWHCSKTRSVTQRELINIPSWHHSQPSELVRRVGTVPAMSAWKATAGHRGPAKVRALSATGKAGRLALTGFRLARLFFVHALMASCERGAPLITRRGSLSGQPSDGDRKRS